MTEFPDDYPRTTDLLEAILRPDGLVRPPAQRAELFDRLHRAGCLPTFYAYCRHIDHPIPDAAHDRWRTHRTRQALYRRELDRIRDRLDETGLQFVVLKGEPLSQLLFDDGRLRFSSDIDLLVAPAHLEETLQALRDEGFRSLTDLPLDAWGNNQRRLVHSTRDSKVEVHWRIVNPYTPAPSATELLEQKQIVQLQDSSVFPTLDSEQTMLQICYNFHHDLGSLKALVDVAGWLDRYRSRYEMNRVAEWFAPWSAEQLLLWPLQALRALGATAVDLPRPNSTLPTAVATMLTAERVRNHFVQLAPRDSRWSAKLPQTARILLDAIQRSGSLTLFPDTSSNPARMLRPIVLGRHRFGRKIAGLLANYFEWAANEPA